MNYLTNYRFQDLYYLEKDDICNRCNLSTPGNKPFVTDVKNDIYIEVYTCSHCMSTYITQKHDTYASVSRLVHLYKNSENKSKLGEYNNL